MNRMVALLELLVAQHTPFHLLVGPTEGTVCTGIHTVVGYIHWGKQDDPFSSTASIAVVTKCGQRHTNILVAGIISRQGTEMSTSKCN